MLDFAIGALAEAAGVSVKTVRYYSDGGLLPVSSRSAGATAGTTSPRWRCC